MSTEIRERKNALRDGIRAQMKRITAPERAAASAQACQLLNQQKVWQEAGSILFYCALRDELDLSALRKEALSQGKRVALPRFVAEDNRYEPCGIASFDEKLSAGRFGILEPDSDAPVFPLNQLDLVLVPGLAFDASGRRLGRGNGFYDRLLYDVRGAKCGVAFDHQIQAELPVEPHDIVLDYLLTQTRWVNTGQGTALK